MDNTNVSKSIDKNLVNAIKALPNIYATKEELRKLQYIHSPQTKIILERIFSRHLKAIIQLQEYNISDRDLLKAFNDPKGKTAKKIFEKVMRQLNDSHSLLKQLELIRFHNEVAMP